MIVMKIIYNFNSIHADTSQIFLERFELKYLKELIHSKMIMHIQSNLKN